MEVIHARGPKTYRMEEITTIRTATASDLSYILSLAKKHTGELGFIPKMGLEQYIAWNSVDLALENNDPCGYILWKKHLGYNLLCPDPPDVRRMFSSALARGRVHDAGWKPVSRHGR